MKGLETLAIASRSVTTAKQIHCSEIISCLLGGISGHMTGARFPCPSPGCKISHTRILSEQTHLALES